MRKRSVGINVRVSVTEKRKMTLMAKRCGLSLSEYLRQRAHTRQRRYLMCWINWMTLQSAALRGMKLTLSPRPTA